MNDILKKIKDNNILGIVGVIALLLGVILPVFKISLFGFSQSFSLLKYWEGYVIIIALIAIAMFVFKNLISSKFPDFVKSGFGKTINEANDKFIFIPIGVVVLILVYLVISLKGNSDLSFAKDLVKYSIGFYCLIIGVISVIAHAVLGMVKVEKK